MVYHWIPGLPSEDLTFDGPAVSDDAFDYAIEHLSLPTNYVRCLMATAVQGRHQMMWVGYRDINPNQDPIVAQMANIQLVD